MREGHRGLHRRPRLRGGQSVSTTTKYIHCKCIHGRVCVQAGHGTICSHWMHAVAAWSTYGCKLDYIRLQAADVAFTSPVVHGHQNSFYSWWRANALLHSEEHKRLAREEWRDELRVYAAPFYNELRMRGQINATRPASASASASSASVSAAGEISAAGDADEAYEAWFVTWV